MFKLTDYIFTPADVLYAVKKISLWDICAFTLLGVVAVLLFTFTEISGEGIFFWLFFISLFCWRIDSRVSIGFALVCLVCIPILLVLFNNDILFLGDVWAEKVAVWAYFFLVIGVVKQIWEFKTEKKEDGDEDESESEDKDREKDKIKKQDFATRTPDAQHSNQEHNTPNMIDLRRFKK